MVLSRKVRERALMGKRSGCPRVRRRTTPRRQIAPRRAASPGIPKAQFARRVHGPNPAPPISPGPPASSPASSMTARRPARLRACPDPCARPSVAGSLRERRLSQWPRARFARAGEDAGAPRGTGRRAHARPRPVIPELPYPGCAGVPPASREARHIDGSYPSIAHPRPRIRGRVASPGSPGIPPSRKPARLTSRKSRNREPAIPDPAAAPAHGPARLSRNSRTAPSRKPARPASRKSRNPGSGRPASARPRPVLPELPERPRPGSPPAWTARGGSARRVAGARARF